MANDTEAEPPSQGWSDLLSGTNLLRSLVVGNPGKIIKEVSDEMLAWKTEGTRLYQQLPEQCYDTLRPCEPLRVVPKNQPEMPVDYAVWKKK
jgi:hypothetical protein